MGRADDLQVMAEEVYGGLLAAYTSAQDAVRADPAGSDVAAACRAAKEALASHRVAVRELEQRAGVNFGADMIRTEG